MASTEHARRALQKIGDRLSEAGRTTAQIRQDEREEASHTLAQGRHAVLWTPAAGRVRCATMDAFVAIQRGAASHPDATPEPVRPERPLRNPHASDPAFWERVHAAARRDYPCNRAHRVGQT